MSSLRPGDYGYRRKRNVDMDERMVRNEYKRDEPISGIDWYSGQNFKLEEGEETILVDDDIEITEDTPLDKVLIGNKKLNLSKFQSKDNIEETEKMTIYLNKSLVASLKMLKKQKSIVSFSQCIRESLEQYLTT